MVKIGVSGALGRMGKRIIHCARLHKEASVVFGLEYKGHPDLGNTVEGVPVTDDPEKITACQSLIEFTSPKATLDHLSFAVKYKKAMVIGTTGFSQQEREMIFKAGEIIPVVFSPNMSVGVNLVFRLLEEAAKVLQDYKVEMEEAHHIHKKDAPSGTAKKMAEIINQQGFNLKYEDIRSLREGEIVGDHKVVFESDVDTVTISHSAKNRDIFAQGAVRAAVWAADKKPGLYSMADILFKS